MIRISPFDSVCLAHSLINTFEKQTKKNGKESGLRRAQNDQETQVERRPGERQPSKSQPCRELTKDHSALRGIAIRAGKIGN
jgi:hypothetical protein